MKSPVVVIVGRPNVGKSTLFNRLVGKREAIVDDISGVTRDRNFMVDVRIGISPIDVEIVNILRSANKDFYLLVNKVDSENFEAAVSEFYKLGVDRTFDLSALVGRKTGDFLDVLTSGFPANIEEKEDTRLKIAILGRPNVGKSSLANSLLGYDRSIVTDIPGTTRDSIDSVLKYYGKEIILVDTAGLRKKKRIDESIEFYSAIRTLKAVGECDVAIVLIDAKIGLDKQDQKIIDEVIRRRKGLILAVNKWDLIEKETNTAGQYEKSINEKLGSIDYVPVIFISALTKQRIFKVIELSNQIGEERKKKIPTNTLNNVLLPEIEKNPPPATGTGKEVKIKYITQGGEHYPVFIFFSNRPKDIPENFKRFLEKLIRKNFGFKGVSFTMVFKTK